jgi:hypothetical protein
MFLTLTVKVGNGRSRKMSLSPNARWNRDERRVWRADGQLPFRSMSLDVVFNAFKGREWQG